MIRQLKSGISRSPNVYIRSLNIRTQVRKTYPQPQKQMSFQRCTRSTIHQDLLKLNWELDRESPFCLYHGFRPYYFWGKQTARKFSKNVSKKSYFWVWGPLFHIRGTRRTGPIYKTPNHQWSFFVPFNLILFFTVWGCSWHSCGHFLATASMDNTSKVWDLNRYEKVSCFSQFQK